MNRSIARLLGVLFAFVLLVAACGDDDTTVTQENAVADESDTDAEPSDDDDGAMEDMEDMEDMDDDETMDHEDDEHDDGAMEEMDHDDHGGDGLEVPDGMAVPTLSIEVVPDAVAGQNVFIDVANFALAPEHASTDPVDGEGHLHLYVDGERKARFYNTALHLNLEPGDHLVEVEVSANNHSPYTVGGERILGSGTISVPEADHEHMHHDNIDVAAASAPQIGVEVVKDPIKGWNVRADVSNFAITPRNASSEHVDGEGHLHLVVDGERVTRMYGSWWHVAELSEGEHEIAVEVSANNHALYAVDGDPVVGLASVTVSAADSTAEAEHDHDDADHDDDHDGAMIDMGLDDADTVIEVGFAGGSVAVEDDRIEVARNSVVAIMINSDVVEHAHLHGYDLFLDVPSGEPAVLVFTADVPGVFEMEFEDSVTFITELIVS